MIPEFPHFKKLELSDKKLIEEYTKKYPPYSDFNFTSMWSWDTQQYTQISILNENLVIKFTDYLTGEQFYSFLGEKNAIETIDTLLSFAEKNNIKPELKLIAQNAVDNAHHLEILPDQNNFDYIYHIEELHACSGKKYETQRNMIHRFEKRDTDHVVRFMDTVTDIKDQILTLNTQWVGHKQQKIEQSHAEHETAAIERIISIADNEHICATCVFKGDKLIAFFINELIPDSEYAIAHFAKADTTLPGIYSYLINQNCKHLLEKGKKYLNYEQDLGLPNLRYSKSSLHPVSFLKKHIIKRKTS